MNGCQGAHGNDKFKIEFPTNINEKTKAILIGATMLVVSLKVLCSCSGILQARKKPLRVFMIE